MGFEVCHSILKVKRGMAGIQPGVHRYIKNTKEQAFGFCRCIMKGTSSVKNPKGREEDTVLQDLAFLQDLANLVSV